MSAVQQSAGFTKDVKIAVLRTYNGSKRNVKEFESFVIV